MSEYIGIGSECGKRVSDDEALNYALKRCGVVMVDEDAPEHEEFCKFLVEWYFSGNWKKVG